MYYFVLTFDFKNKKDSPIGKRYDARLLLEAEFIQWQEETKDKTPGKGGEPKVSFERYSNREYALDGEEVVRREHEYSKQHIHDFYYYV